MVLKQHPKTMTSSKTSNKHLTPRGKTPPCVTPLEQVVSVPSDAAQQLLWLANPDNECRVPNLTPHSASLCSTQTRDTLRHPTVLSRVSQFPNCLIQVAVKNEIWTIGHDEEDSQEPQSKHTQPGCTYSRLAQARDKQAASCPNWGQTSQNSLRL